jgi:hypothetical protein
MLARIFVNAQRIRDNDTHGTANPPITVQTSEGDRLASEVIIDGPSRVVYSPNPLPCGARCWIETDDTYLTLDPPPNFPGAKP